MTYWYTADLHFNHDNIIRFCNRPFSTTAEMDAFYIRDIQSKVKADDELWILGDFCFGKQTQDEAYLKGLFDQIPGRKHLIRGNHDKPWIERWGWASRRDLYEINDEGQKIVLCHYPLRSWNGKHRDVWHFYGHVHCEDYPQGPSWNVGVDQTKSGCVSKGSLTQYNAYSG